jgi:hypothetical protein
MKRASILMVLTLLLFLCCGIALAAFIYKRNVMAKRFEEILNVLESETHACIVEEISIETPRTAKDKALVKRVIAKLESREASIFAKQFASIIRKYWDRDWPDARLEQIYPYEITFGTNSVWEVSWAHPSIAHVEYTIKRPSLKGAIYLEKEARMEIKGLIESLSSHKSRND